MPRGIKVAGITFETFSALVVNPKKKNPKTSVVGNIIIIPEICGFVFSAINESIVIKAPPTKKETNSWTNKIVIINLSSICKRYDRYRLL